MSAKRLSIEEKMVLTSQEYRLRARRGEWELDEDPEFSCEGYTKHALVVLPKDYAFEFLTFCIRNPRACYVSEVLEVGSPHTKVLAPDADIRTDLAFYRVYQHGEVVDEPRDIVKYWRDDMVAFLLPCSYSFEGVLRNYNVKFRFMGAFDSNIPAVPAGRFKNDNMIVSLRLFATKHDAIRAVQVTSRLPFAHGSPIHIGDPSEIGVEDIFEPTNAPPYPPPTKPQLPGEICMAWACANTPARAIIAAKPPLAIMHYPSMVFVSDHHGEEFAFTEEVSTNLELI